MVKTNDYPAELIRGFKDRAITRQQFINLMHAWQAAHGIDYRCRGTADKNAVWVIYRGIPGIISNGEITWLEEGAKRTAHSFYEFRRQVDFMKDRNHRTIRYTLMRAETFAGTRG